MLLYSFTNTYNSSHLLIFLSPISFYTSLDYFHYILLYYLGCTFRYFCTSCCITSTVSNIIFTLLSVVFININLHPFTTIIHFLYTPDKVSSFCSVTGRPFAIEYRVYQKNGYHTRNLPQICISAEKSTHHLR